MQEGSVNNT